MKIIKRNGQEVEYDAEKLRIALNKANENVTIKSKRITKKLINEIVTSISDNYCNAKRIRNVEYIQDLIEQALVEAGAYSVAKEYITYRYKRSLARKSNATDNKILSLIDHTNEEIKQENANKNPVIASTERDYIAGEVSKDITNRILLSDDIVEAHNKGIIHFHDADYFIQHIFNCCLINLEDMLQNGTVISGTMIEKPHSFSTACNIATQIIAQVASNQYGGQSISLAHLAPFVDISRQKIRKEVIEEQKQVFYEFNPQAHDFELSEKFNKVVDSITNKRLKDEIKRGIQTLQYQLITLMTTNGQAPFLTIFVYLNEAKNDTEKHDLAMVAEELFEQRIEGVKNETGHYITIAFPKLIYVLEEDNIAEDSKYWGLTKLAAKCTAKRMVPDYISEKKMKEYKEGNCFPVMGCRSCLNPWKDANGKYKFYGRFNQGVCTISLPYIGLLAHKDTEEFWNLLDKYCELCHKALKLRHERLEQTISDVSPIHWQHGAIARLPKGASIHELLHSGYSSISLGYAGLWECVYSLIEKKLTEPDGEDLGIKIMQFLNDKCNQWKAEEDIAYSLYGTPLESTTYKFGKALQKDFGIIQGVSDKDYVTNSYHIHVTEPIDAFSKLTHESRFQKLSPGGAISYIEVPNMQNNISAVLEVLKHIYNTIMYAELNSKSDYCQVCEYDGEIEIVTDPDSGKLIWKCPNCGNIDRDKMNIARRVCGYISTNDFNQGRTQEIKERVMHLGNE